MHNNIEKIAIVGGGTSGWMAACVFGKIFRNTTTSVTVVESPDIGAIGVGEATIPAFMTFLKDVGIDEVDFIRSTQSTFKLGIEFRDWHHKGSRYFHPFASPGRPIDGHHFYQCWLKSRHEGDLTPLMAHSPEAVLSEHNRFFLPHKAKGTPLAKTGYALHLDSILVGKYLRDHALAMGVVRNEDTVMDIDVAETGLINSVRLKSGEVVEADLFVDCTGFRGKLIEDALNVGYEDWSDYLPCNRAVAVQTTHDGVISPYTISTARAAGWSWKIPLQSRVGNGYVFCDKYCSDDEAINTLLKSVEGEVFHEPRVIPFVTGKRKKVLHKNCLSLGLSQGFLEPLESTAIHLVYKTLTLFIRFFPDKGFDEILEKEFNNRVSADYEEIRDFIVLHYCGTQRADTPFWEYCKNMPLPDELVRKIAIFRARGEVFPGKEDLFLSHSWQAVFEGMGVEPKSYNPTVDALNYDKLQASMNAGRDALRKEALKQPNHQDFIQKYCPAK